MTDSATADPLTAPLGLGAADILPGAPSCGGTAPCVPAGVPAVTDISVVAARAKAEELEEAEEGSEEPTATLELPTEPERGWLAVPWAELEEESVTAEEVGEVEAPLPPPDDAGSTTPPMGTSAADASMIIETKTASHTALLRGDIGRALTFPDRRRMRHPHSA